jgi:hypothetical protein
MGYFASLLDRKNSIDSRLLNNFVSGWSAGLIARTERQGQSD